MKKVFLISAFICFSFIGFGQCPSGIIELETQADIDNFSINYPGCTQLLNGLNVGNMFVNTGITNLNGLSQITHVGIDNNGEGGGLFIDKTSITDLSGLENLEYVGGRFWVLESNITNLDGLDNLTTIKGGVTFQANPFLINFEGLPPEVTIEEGFFIFFNPLLQNFDGLNIIGEGGSYTVRITISGNQSLQNLVGLEGFETGERLKLLNNNSLVSIDQVSNFDISTSGAILDIIGNNNLSNCSIQSVCNVLNDPDVTVQISDNAVNCNSIPEVEQSCLLNGDDFSLSERLILYPNPVSTILQIHTSENILIQNTSVYSLMGEELISTGKRTVDFSNFSKGVYFVEVSTDHGIITKKVVKK